MIDSASTIPVSALKPLPAQEAVGFSAITATDPVSAQTYAVRDRQLAWRDLQTAYLLAKTALRASTVVGAKAPRPSYPMVISDDFLAASGDRPGSGDRLPTSSNPSRVAHVLYSSAPIDAALADKSLYERDVMLAEAAAILADKFASASQPAVVGHADGSITSSLVDLSNWSLAEGQPIAAGVCSNLPLNCQTFKQPDTALADRDNVLAAVAARMAAWMSNPFEASNRLLVEVRDGSGTLQVAAEPYLLSSDTSTAREWTAAAGRPKIVYSKTRQTVQWIGADNDVRIPQDVDDDLPLAGSGARLVLQIPTDQDVSVWRRQAARLVTRDAAETTESVFTASGGQQQEFNSIVIPGTSGAVSFASGTAMSGTVRAAVMAWARGPVRLPGQVYQTGSNVSVVGRGLKYTTSSGSGTWAVTLPAGLTYQIVLKVSVVDGSGSFTVAGSGLASFSQSISSSGSVSTGATTTASGSLTLAVTAAGAARLVVDEVAFVPTSYPSDTQADLQFSAQLAGQGCPASVTVEYGRPAVVDFQVSSGSGANLSVNLASVSVGCVVQSPAIWTQTPRYAPAYALAVRAWKTSLLKKAEARLADAYRASIARAGLRYPIDGGNPAETLSPRTSSQAYSAGALIHVDSSQFPVYSGAAYVSGTTGSGATLGYTTNTSTPAFVVVKYTPSGGVAAHFRGRKSVDLGDGTVGIPAGTLPTNPEYWGRVADPPIFAYTAYTAGTSAASVPAGLLAGNREVTDGSVVWRRRQGVYQISGAWTVESTRAWMASLTAGISSLTGSGGIIRLATAADIGRPALIPRGLKWTVSARDGSASLPTGPEDATPEFTALQPWMLAVEAYVAHEDFWV